MDQAVKLTPPRIGQPWPEQGGIYAGIMAGRDGANDYHLIVAPTESEIEAIAWGSYGKTINGTDSYFDGRANTIAMVTAGLPLGQQIMALQVDGHTDYHLPSQAEMHLLAANLKDHFNQDDWYWTSTQSSAYYAWMQDFDDGLQSINLKSSTARAVAVRRLVL